MDGKLKSTYSEGVYRRGKSIQIKFQYNGVRCAETLKILPTISNLKYATKFRTKILFEIGVGVFNYAKTFPNSKNIHLHSKELPSTVKKELLNYIEEQRNEKMAHSTWEHYRKIIDTYLIPEFGDYLITDITPSLIKDWRRELHVGNKTKNNILVPFRRMFKEAFLDEKIDKNPFDRIQSLKFEKEEVNPFLPKEIVKILSSFDNQRRNYFQFQFSTGLRPSESIALTWDDIHWDTLKISVNKAFVAKKLKETKTKAGKRFVTIRKPVLQALLNQMPYTFVSNQHVFHNPNTNQPWKSDDAVRKTWLYALKRAGVEYRNPYQSRHTFASMMLTLGEDQYKVMSEMGHKSFHELESTYAQYMHGILNSENKDFNGVWSQICHEVHLSD